MCVSYIIDSAVCLFVSQYGQNEADVLLLTGQWFVVEAVVLPLLLGSSSPLMLFEESTKKSTPSAFEEDILSETLCVCVCVCVTYQ